MAEQNMNDIMLTINRLSPQYIQYKVQPSDVQLCDT